MREQYMRCGEGFVLCYSVTDRRSFRAAAEYRRLLAQARPSERLPLVLVGNKLDLAPRFRQVSLLFVGRSSAMWSDDLAKVNGSSGCGLLKAEQSVEPREGLCLFSTA